MKGVPQSAFLKVSSTSYMWHLLVSGVSRLRLERLFFSVAEMGQLTLQAGSLGMDLEQDHTLHMRLEHATTTWHSGIELPRIITRNRELK